MIRGGKERVTLLVPYADLGKVSSLRSEGIIEEQEYTEEGIKIVALLERGYVDKYAGYKQNG